MTEQNRGAAEAGETLFNPPLYKQRYSITATILKDPRWANEIHKVVDFGCSELKLVPYLKALPNIEHILEVDTDIQTLEAYKFRASPLLVECLKRRNRPLTIDILHGSVIDYDVSLEGADAVIGIELIEHLHDDVLENVPKTVFGCIQPLLTIITTPNKDFNKLFNRLEGFRHWDHKFEWTRSEFNEWAKSIVEKYPNYSYEITGVGNPPEGSDTGCCTQIAIFHRHGEKSSVATPGKFYDVVAQYDYPVEPVDPRSDEEKLVDEIVYRINCLSAGKTYQSYEEDFAYIPVGTVLSVVQYWCPNCTEKHILDIAADKFSVVEKEGVMTVRVDLNDPDENVDLEKAEEPNFYPIDPPPALNENEVWETDDDNCETNDCPGTSQVIKIDEPSGEGAGLDFEAEDPWKRMAPMIDTSWAVAENEENRIAESLRNQGLLLPPPAGYYDDEDEDECEERFDDFHDEDDNIADDYDDFDDCFRFASRGDDSEWMCASYGPGAKTDATSSKQPKSETKSEFPKSTSVEVLHHDGPSSQGRPARIQYGDLMTLCYTGQDRQNGPQFTDSPVADSCSFDEPDRAADSGYPNSSSLNHEVDVDADLTPEQVDDISRSEDEEPSLSDDAHSDVSAGGDGDARVAQPAARLALPLVFANVENGDLANNNRDGEGNNAAPEDIPGLALEFAAVVHEEDQQALLAAAAPAAPAALPAPVDAPQVDDDDVLPEYADPFPPWLSDLLGLNRREGATGGGDEVPDMSDADEGLGDENLLSWSGDAPPDLNVNRGVHE